MGRKPQHEGPARYFSEVRGLFDRLEQANTKVLHSAVDDMADRIIDGGRILLFGAGHSGLACQDVYYRAGGLKDLVCIFDPRLTLDFDPVEETSLSEKLEGALEPTMERFNITSRDVLICVSTSGINAAPVEAALHAHSRGALVLAITSSIYTQTLPPRHSSGRRLADIADHVLDNLAPFGDTVVKVRGDEQMGSTSTLGSAALLQAMTIALREECFNRGTPLAVFVSGNIPGGMERNRKS